MKGKEKNKEQLIDELVKLEIKHQQIEKTLSDNEEKYRTLVELATDGILIETVEGRILECNTACAKIYGYTKEEMMSLTLADLVPEEFAKKLPKIITDKETTHGIFLPRISKKKNGTIFPTEATSKIVNIGGKPRLIAYVRDITKSKEAEKKLKKTRKMFASLFKSSPQALAYLDPESNILNINSRFSELFGYTLEEVKGRNIDDGMIHPPDKMEEGKELTEKSLKGDFYYETIRKKKDGTLFPVTISGSQVIIDGQLKGLIGTFQDITERKKAEEILKKSQQEFSSLFQSHSEALLYVDKEGTILDINKRFMELFGYTLKEIKGKNINCGIIHPLEKIVEGEELDKKAISRDYVRFETIRKKKDGTLFPVSISASPVVINGESKGIIGTYIDITERKRMEEKLKELARIDTLTGCYSRRYGLELLDRQLKLSQRSKFPLLLAFLDIDGFKLINDNFGHDEGDQALKQSVELFKSTLREVDIICRMGGDEFLLIFPDNSLKEVSLIRNRLQKNLSQLNKRIKKDYQIKFSMGFSEYLPDKPETLDELIAIADRRMYEEKKKNKEQR